MPGFYPPDEEAALIAGLDPGIQREVEVLRQHQVETFESCDGMPGHSYMQPTVCFHGNQAEGFRAFGIARLYGLPVAYLRRYWTIEDGEPNGPKWQMVFRHPGGGGSQCQELPNGEHTWTWGPVRLTEPEQRIAELENALENARHEILRLEWRIGRAGKPDCATP